MPVATGWRPDDVKEKYPITIITNLYTYEKYRTASSISLKIWSWTQLIITLLLLYYLLTHFGDFEFSQIINYAIFIAISIFGYTSLMDRHNIAIYSEIIKTVFGIFLIVTYKGWFGMDSVLYNSTYIVFAYLVLSLLASIYFQLIEHKLHKKTV